mgnify:CR=1 FL=1
MLNRAAAKKRLVELAEKYQLYVDPDAKVCDLSVGEQWISPFSTVKLIFSFAYTPENDLQICFISRRGIFFSPFL